MKSILENKKSRIFSLGIVLAGIISLGIFAQSCSNEDEYINSDNNSKLELLINSSEYKTLNNNLESFGENLKSNYSKLSNVEKGRVLDILDIVKTDTNSQEELEILFKEFNAILKIDFNTTTIRISENVAELNLYKEVNNISNKEFTVAVNKFPNSIPRLKSGFENDDTAICIGYCSAITGVCLMACTGPQALAGCHAACLAAYALCCLLC
ncbi:MAG: hypothetical protein LBG96_08350 [Tannerella sp.]|jgi:hypothetical protein|nr:hypothetical protein [Tannerella sp.]